MRSQSSHGLGAEKCDISAHRWERLTATFQANRFWPLAVPVCVVFFSLYSSIKTEAHTILQQSNIISGARSWWNSISQIRGWQWVQSNDWMESMLCHGRKRPSGAAARALTSQHCVLRKSSMVMRYVRGVQTKSEASLRCHNATLLKSDHIF